MAETKRTQSEQNPSEDVDPRRLLAQRYMQKAHDELAAKEADRPGAKRQRPERRSGQRAGTPRLADLKPSISSSTLLHGMMLMFVLTIASLATLFCYTLMNQIFVVGRVIALPVGILVYIGLSYASACYLGVIESTSRGHTTPDDVLTGDWRDWFWTMPATFGILAATAGLGWLISRAAPSATWEIIGVTVWLFYPVLQLSTLETGSFVSLISLPVLSTLFTRPIMWMTLYGLSFVLGITVAGLGAATWRDPPFLTMLWMGPIAAVALLVYGWLLGQTARWMSVGGR